MVIRFLMASRVTRANLFVPNLCIALYLWLSTVLGEIPKMAAASLTEQPRLTRRMTSFSRGDSAGTLRRGEVPVCADAAFAAAGFAVAFLRVRGTAFCLAFFFAAFLTCVTFFLVPRLATMHLFRVLSFYYWTDQGRRQAGMYRVRSTNHGEARGRVGTSCERRPQNAIIAERYVSSGKVSKA